MAVITVANAQTWLDVTGDDAVLQILIDRAVEAMERAAGRHLDAATVTEVLDGNGDYSLWLQEPPDGGADGVTSVHVSSDQEWTSSNLVDSDDYLVNECELIYLDHVWTKGQQNVRVIYSGGFATVPDDVVGACYEQVAADYQRWLAAKKGFNILDTVRIENWTMQFRKFTGLEPQVERVCKTYRPARA